MSRDQVFISYSHADSNWLERLQVMLAPLQRQGMLKVWADTDIQPGQLWKEEIKQALAKAKVAMLLVSSDFLASDFIDKHELPPLLDAATKEGLVILWVLVRPSVYEKTAIGKYQAAYDPKIPLSTLTLAQQEMALVAIAQKLMVIQPLSSPAPAPVPLPETILISEQIPQTPFPPPTPHTPSSVSWRPLLIATVLGILSGAGAYHLGHNLDVAVTPPPQQSAGARSPSLPPIQNIHGWSTQQAQELQKQTALALKQDIEFRDPLKAGDQGPLMVVIPRGRFQMGSPDTEPGRSQDERQHEVEVQVFAIGKYEVTVEQFKRFVEITNYKTEAEKSGGCYYWTGSEWKQDADKNWRNPGFSQTDNYPVVCISWDDAMEYVNWLERQTGKQYHLPTESEWEYAVRAGKTTPFDFGDTISTDQANYNGNYTYGNGHKGVYRQKTVEVGLFRANAWGLHDMHGNVFEWTCSVYDKEYNGSEQQPCPEPIIWIPYGVLRGGSWFDKPDEVRGAVRYEYLPLHPGSTNFGFRLARTFP